MTDVMKHRIFDVALTTMDIRLDGYEIPNEAQIANTKNMAARENKMYLDKFTKGNSVRRAKLDISQRNSGRKYGRVNCVAGVGGYVLHMTIRSNGSSDIIGAAQGDLQPVMSSYICNNDKGSQSG